MCFLLFRILGFPRKKDGEKTSKQSKNISELLGDLSFKSHNSELYSGPAYLNHSNGELAMKGNYDNGKQVGEWNSFFDNGQLDINGFFKDGKMHGKHSFYHKNGILYRVTEYKNGNEDGDNIQYFQNGNKEYKEIYENGWLKSKTNYDLSGNIEKEFSEKEIKLINRNNGIEFLKKAEQLEIKAKREAEHIINESSIHEEFIKFYIEANKAFNIELRRDNPVRVKGLSVKGIEQLKLFINKPFSFSLNYFNQAKDIYDKMICREEDKANGYFKRGITNASIDYQLSDIYKLVSKLINNYENDLWKKKKEEKKGLNLNMPGFVNFSKPMGGNFKIELDNYLENAINDFTKAISYNSKDDTFFKERGNCYMNQMTKNMNQMTKKSIENAKKSIENAIKDYEKSYELYDEDPYVIVNLGFANFNIDKYLPAINFLSKYLSIALDKYSEYYLHDNNLIERAYNHRYSSFVKLGEYKNAINDITKLIEMDKDNIQYYINRGVLYYETDQEKLAYKDRNEVYRINIDHKSIKYISETNDKEFYPFFDSQTHNEVLMISKYRTKGVLRWH